MTGTINFDDPSTWPKDYDIDGLAALADGTQEEPKEEGTAAQTQGDDKETPAQEDTKEETQEATETSKEGVKEEEQNKDPEGVYAKDGKHILPFEVVSDLRRKNKELSEQLTQLQTTAAAKREPEPAATQRETPTDEDRDPLEMSDEDLSLTGEALEARLQEIESEYGRGERSKWKRIFDATVRLSAMEANQQRTTQDQVQNAIDNNPVLMAWQQDDNQIWYKRANDMHQFLMATDADYQAAPLDKQMETLVEKTEVFHGKSPHREKIKSLQGEAKNTPKAPVSEKDSGKPETPTIPTSMSTIPGGTPPDLGFNETLGKMTPMQMQAYFNKLAENPDKLNETLASL